MRLKTGIRTLGAGSFAAVTTATARAEGIAGKGGLGNSLDWLSRHAAVSLIYLPVAVTLAALFARGVFFTYRRLVSVPHSRPVVEGILFTLGACALLAIEPQVVTYDFEEYNLTNIAWLVAFLLCPLALGRCLICDLTLAYRLLSGRRLSRILTTPLVLLSVHCCPVKRRWLASNHMI